MLAAEMGSGESQVVAQEVCQSATRLGQSLAMDAIDSQFNHLLFACHRKTSLVIIGHAVRLRSRRGVPGWLPRRCDTLNWRGHRRAVQYFLRLLPPPLRWPARLAVWPAAPVPRVGG